MFQLDKKHQTYEKYNPTNIDWIWDIPDGWEARKLKYVSKSSFQYGANEAALDDNLKNPRFVRITDIDEKGNLRPETFKSLEEDIARDFILHDGDILFARSGATVGKTFQYRPDWGKCCYAGYLIRMTVDEKTATSDFIYYITKSSLYEGWKDSIFIKATIQNISAEKYKSFFVAIPSLGEQQKITNYLDEKTALLDEIIAKKKKQIELLGEHRTALINNAITKGLDENVEMRDSGIEWIGKIPKEWELKKLKYLADINALSLTEDTSPDYELQYLDISNVDINGIVSEAKEMIFSNAPSRARRIVRHNDIIVGTVRTYLKAIAFLDNPPDNLIVSTGFATLTAKEKEILPKFLYYNILAEYFISKVVALSKGVSYPAINATEIATLEILLPNISEQKKIADYLDKETKYIDDMIAKIKNSIELLEEYKTSLISHAVSGKIKVS